MENTNDIKSLIARRDELCYLMIEADGNDLQEFDKELDIIETQLQQLGIED